MSFPSVRAAAIALLAMPCVLAVPYLLHLRATRGRAQASVLPSVDPAPPEEPLADWCAPGFDAVPGGCLAAPAEVPAESLVVYLHGRYARDVAADEIDRQRRLGARATKKHYAVLALRSRLGVCSSAELADWYCWPTSDAAADADAMRRWTRVVDDMQRRVAAPRRYLLGFSSGGYFAGMVASRGWAPFDAVVVAHGGPVEPVSPSGDAPPMLLLSADDDVAQLDMMRFDDDLRRAGWPHDAYARGGAHGLADADIDTALTFFARSRESMPLRPPLSLHRAVFHVRDAVAEASAPDDDAATNAAAPPETAPDPFEAPADDN
jgi:predicted esterase